MAASWNIVVPVRAFASGKTRLRRSLHAPIVTEIARRLALRTLGALEAVPEIASVYVVTSEAEAAFEPFSKVCLVGEGEPVGLNAAVDLGLAAVDRQRGSDVGPHTLVMHADLPLLSAEAVSDMLRACAETGGQGCVSDRAGSGTTALSFSGEERRIRHGFGAGSAARHLAVGFQPVPLPTQHPTRCDLDTFDDLLEYSRTPHWPAIAELVAGIPVSARRQGARFAHAE